MKRQFKNSVGGPARGRRARHFPRRRSPRRRPARPDKIKKLTFPGYKEFALKNGMEVLVVEHHEQPMVSLYFVFKTGSALDPKGKESLASFTIDQLNKGTKTKTALQLAEWIESVGGSVGRVQRVRFLGDHGVDPERVHRCRVPVSSGRGDEPDRFPRTSSRPSASARRRRSSSSSRSRARWPSAISTRSCTATIRTARKRRSNR